MVFIVPPALMAWSSGKDSALALWRLMRENQYEVTLLATLTEGYDRVSMHGVREELLDAQAAALGLPLDKIWIPPGCPHEEYAARMAAALARHKERGCEVCFFGDIFLADVRAYREENLARIGMRAAFPLWGEETAVLAAEFIRQGFRATITCVDTRVLDGGFAGEEYGEDLIRRLPPGVDVCGENGEFHTFVHDGPLFAEPVRFCRGETVLREERFRFCDLLPEAGA
ncbi:MAG: ATP-binding protein [Patescibacteria group bacterium]